MTKRAKMLVGGLLGAIWALGVVWIGATFIELPIFALTPTLLLAFLGPGLVIALMIFWSAMRRFRSDALMDGSAAAVGSAAEVDARVLRNTVEQTVLALCLWPAIGFLAADDGPGLILALSLSFPIARLAYWIGYRISPPLRLFGFAATFYATVFALFWAVGIWLI